VIAHFVLKMVTFVLMADYPPVGPINDQEASQDYYIENGLLVMTEAFHLKRGYCCGNECRHCPYEHINVVKKKKPSH
jgi:hypothetical protein